MATRKGGADQARRNGGIEIIVEQDDPLEDHFKTLPNALLRGEVDDKYGFDFRGYTLRERALLAALVSNAKVYRCTRGRIEALAPELGADGLDTVINGLKHKGHLRTTRVNDPDNRGRFVWRWEVSLRPKYAAAAAGAADETAAESMGGLDPHGQGPAQTMGGSAIDGPAMGGSAGSKYLKDHGLEEPPPPPAPAAARSAPSGPEEEEESPNQDHPPQHVEAARVLEQAVQAAGGRPLPPARAAELTRAVAARLAAGWSEPDVLAALSDPLAGTQSPYAIMRWRVANLLAGPPPAPRTAGGKPAPAQRRPQCETCAGERTVAADPVVREFVGRTRQVVQYVPCPDCSSAEVAA